MRRHPHSLAEWCQLVKAAVLAWSDDYAPSMGAALAYYSVFSLAPLLLIVISIAGLVFGQEAARGEVFAQLSGLLGSDSARLVEATLTSLSKPWHGFTATAIGAVALLVGATSVFAELQNALDRIWRAPARNPSGGLWGLVRARLLSFGMILGIAFLLMVSLVISAAISALGKWWGGFFGDWEVLLQTVNVLVGFAFTTAVFAMIYKLMPRVQVRWHDVWLGAATTSVLFTVGRFLIGLYIGKSGIASVFGAAGSIAVIFVWVYYSSQIFLLGAEFTWVYANRFGSLRREQQEAQAAPVEQSESAPGGAAPAMSPAAAGLDANGAGAVATDGVAAPGRDGRGTMPMLELGAALAAAVALRYVLPRVVERIVVRLMRL